MDRKGNRREALHRLGDGGGGGSDRRVRREGLEPSVDIHLRSDSVRARAGEASTISTGSEEGALMERISRRRRSARPTSLSQMRRAARRASAREANGEAAAIAAAKRRLPLTRSTSSAERVVGVAISPAANSTAHGGAGMC